MLRYHRSAGAPLGEDGATGITVGAGPAGADDG